MSKLEAEIQRQCKAVVEREFGGKFFKWVSPGTLGVPDGIMLIPGMVPVFVEVKRPKKGIVSGMQGHLMSWMRRSGFVVWVVRDADELRDMLRRLRAITR